MSYLKQYVFLSNLIHFFKKIGRKRRECEQNKTKQNKTKPLFRCGGGGAKGGCKQNGFPQIINSSKSFKTNFMSWYRSWVNESTCILTIEIEIQISVV